MDVHSFGSSTAWYRSWLFWYARPRLRFECVLFGYGIKVRVLKKRSDWGMLPRMFDVSVYWNWHPHPSWVAAKEKDAAV